MKETKGKIEILNGSGTSEDIVGVIKHLCLKVSRPGAFYWFLINTLLTRNKSYDSSAKLKHRVKMNLCYGSNVYRTAQE